MKKDLLHLCKSIEICGQKIRVNPFNLCYPCANMNVEELREYCLCLKSTTEHFPFDDVSLVIKVQGKMFALIPLDATTVSISLKCDPERAITLREQYPCVTAAYHFNKKHWNSVQIDDTITKKQLFEWINHSYELVVAGLPKKQREQL